MPTPEPQESNDLPVVPNSAAHRLTACCRAATALALLPLVGPLSTPLSAFAAEDAPASPPPEAQKVVIVGARSSDTDQRRYSTAAKQVYGREEISRYGDATLGEALKRLPGVTIAGTPGRGGDIRMRGLGSGYTLVLINGEPAPRGFSMDSLTPDQVERIEVMRAPVAEFSNRAVAGTINIVLREKFVKKLNEAQLGLGVENGHVQPILQFNKSDGGPDFDYNLHVSPGRNDRESHSETTRRTVDPASGATTQEQHLRDDSESLWNGIHAMARFNWKFGGDTLSLNPFIMQARYNASGRTHLDQTVGAAPAPYADATYRTITDSTVFRLMGNWRRNFSDKRRLDVRFSGNLANRDTSTSQSKFDAAGAPLHTSSNDDSVRDSGFSTAGKYSAPIGQGHAFAFGWELEHARRTESATTVQDGVAQLAEFGNSIEAATRRIATYAQDEWDATPLLSFYGGLRWEGIKTDSRWASGSAGNDSSVLSPLLHGVWRFTEASRDQVRLGVTRSYKSPTLGQLTPRPSLASDYPASGTNTATSPDSTGNPDLKPELAWGLDLAFEHYLTEGGILSASLFQRNIDNLIRNVTSQQTVSWSASPRWVTTPENTGRARTAGLELEAKFRLAELLADAPPLDLRANAARYVSHVSGVPGPNNRLDQQPNWSANLGLDYRLRALPLTLGGNINWTPAFSIRQTDAQYYDQGVKRVLDAYGLWKFDPNTQLRISLANLIHGDYLTGSRYADGSTDQTTETRTRTYWSLTARLEIKF